MPRGPKPLPPGEAIDPRNQVHKWKTAPPGVGWRHGDPNDRRRKYPLPPDGLLKESIETWGIWLRSRVATFWEPHDLPTLRLAIATFDRVRREQLGPEKMTPLLDRLGLTEKGRQDNRWDTTEPAPTEPTDDPAEDKSSEIAQKRAARQQRIS